MTALARIRPEQLPTVAPRPEQPCGLSLLPKKAARELAASPDRALVLAECRAIQLAAEPATLEQFGVEVERIDLHYPQTRLSPDELLVVKRDWRRLLGHLPPDIVREAADECLLKHKFRPSLAEFAAIAEPMWKWRQALARRAVEALDLMNRQEAA